MPLPVDTLDSLWTSLGLDALQPDSGAKEDLRATRARDWEADTIRMDRANRPVAERTDLPRLSLTSPIQPTGPGANGERELAVIGLLGEGGMGRVLLARQQALDRDVAVKITHPDASAGTVQALVQEARTAGALEHPGIIPVYALASDAAGRPALVMKRVDGVPWGRLLYDDADPAWQRVLVRGGGRLEAHVDILIQVCNAIAFAHSRGVLHRDLKPANVLVGEFGEVFVADWGIATRKPAPGEVRKPCLIGTPCYLPPEMVTGDDAQMDERSDVFLLGATLYEVLAGRPPWGGTDLRETLAEAWECRDPPLPATAPEELQRVCRKAMAARPADRYQTAVELRDALGAFLRHRGSVELARAAQERLDRLTAQLKAGQVDPAIVYPLLSECRFGFAQALREWPENVPARAGLQDSIEAAARYEVAVGNPAAARAYLRELERMPVDLEHAIEELEHAAATRDAQARRIKHLSKEFDPQVSRGPWVAFSVVLGVATVVLVTLRYNPAVNLAIAEHSAWYMVVLMATFNLVFGVGLWMGRRSLLATRVNRRIAGMVAGALLGSLANRLLIVLTGADVTQTMVSDLVVMGAACVVGALTLYWAFGIAAAILGLGATLVALFPAWASPIYGVSSVAGLVVLSYSRRFWRSELWVDHDGSGKPTGAAGPT